MAEESTQGTSLYEQPAVYFGDASLDPQKILAKQVDDANAQRLKAQEEARKKAAEQKKIDDANRKAAYAELEQLPIEGWSGHDQERSRILTGLHDELTQIYQEYGDEAFKGPEGLKRQNEFNKKKSNYKMFGNYSKEVAGHIKSELTKVTETPELYTQESIEAVKNYRNLPYEQQLEMGVPSLDKKKKYTDWDKALIQSERNKFRSADKKSWSSSTGSGSKGVYVADDDRIGSRAEELFNRAVHAEERSDDMGIQMYKDINDEWKGSGEELKYSTEVGEDGLSERDRAFKEYFIKSISDKLRNVQVEEDISSSSSYRDPNSGKGASDDYADITDEPTPGSTDFGAYSSDFENTYSIDLNKGADAFKSISIPGYYIDDEGNKVPYNGNITLSKGAQIEEGHTGGTPETMGWSGKEGMEPGSYVKMSVKMSEDEKLWGTEIDTGDQKTVVRTIWVPITESVDKDLKKSSPYYNRLMSDREAQTGADQSSGNFDPNAY